MLTPLSNVNLRKALFWAFSGIVMGTMIWGCGDQSSHVETQKPRGRLRLLSQIPAKGARDVAFRGNRLFVAQNMIGMVAADISDPSEPTVVRSYSPENIQPLALKMDGNLLLVCDRFRGLAIWRLSRIDDLTSLSQLALPGIATHLDTFVRGKRKYAAVACGGEGLTVVEYTNPSSPRICGRFRVDIDYARHVVTWENLALMSDNANGGLKILDLSRPDDPRLLLKILMRGYWETATVSGDYLFTTHRMSGLRVFRIAPGAPSGDDRASTPTVAYLSNVVRSKNDTRDLVSAGRFLLVCDDLQGVDLYDAINPARPILADEFVTDNAAVTAEEYRGVFYVASWDSGVYALRIAQ